MSVTARCVQCYCKLLNRTLYVNFISVRNLPRWKHRRPIGIVGSEVTEKEKELWKLNVEREIKPVRGGISDSKLFSGPSATNIIEENERKQENLDHSVHKNISRKAIIYTSKQSIGVPKLMNGDEVKPCSTGSNFEHQKTKKSNVNYKNLKSELESEEAAKLRISASKLGIPMFIDLETNDSLLSKYMINVKSKKRREKKGLVLLEGKRLIKDALQAGIVPDVVFFSRIDDLRSLDLPQTGIKIYKITYKYISLWSDVETPQGVVAFVKIPNLKRKVKSSLPLTIICDNVRDPGNMGTILRTCAGIGCNQVLLTKGCVDLWEPKVLRAAAGAHFRLSIEKNLEWSDIMSLISNNSCSFVAENNLSNKTKPLSYPPASQRDLTLMRDEENNCIENGTPFHSSFNQKTDLALPSVIPYYAFDYNSVESLVLIIGGETEGVSFNAYEMVSKTGGARLNVPLSNGVESLNVGTALGIIGFEMKKQLLNASNSEEPKSEIVVSNM